MKKLLGILFAALLLAAVLPVVASAASSGTCGQNMTWVLDDDGKLSISGTGAMTSHPWTASEVKKVVIEEGVTNIGSSAFAGCSELTSVIIPENVVNIGDYAFQDCKKLAEITIPNGTIKLGEYVFYNCTALKDIQIADSVTSLGYSVFSGCSSLIEITLPKGLTTLLSADSHNYDSRGQFYGCYSLKRVIFPDDITSISYYSVPSSTSAQLIVRAGSTTATTLSKLTNGNSQKLTSLDSPDFRWKQTVDGDGNASLTITAYVGTDKQVSVPAIIDDAEVTALNDNFFKDNTTITRVSLPITLTSIGNYAFSGCTALQQVDLPDYLERIGNYAFQNCSRLDNVVLSEELTDLGAGAFTTAPALAPFACRAA